ncbi:hypothetical protein D6850_00185 [Roseovarius spongiae]|uniref:Zinc finger/thioredoxin putative domain-containing protein n=1 Tax=Roseovarius spongiae TaxID=2320272 RepID=A0A3A8B3M1_9RHOB|nr:zinc-ribbon domain-containing protein [Roseovarius spongiae]RKF16031.1 hypothetical protein D6850_00185 [Roseovarius spongiae]
MRLTCPNCGAQYEIPDDVLPETGRDVQCSNCGDTWFQHHPDHDPAKEAEPAEFARAPAPDAPQDAPQGADDDAHAQGDAPGPAAATPTGSPRRELDPEVSSVLREEAEREARARAREAGNLESQPELGLDDGAEDMDRRSREARARMARLRGEPDPAPDGDAAAAGGEIDPTSRRGLLPDIEEINSSLRNEESAADADAMQDAYPEAPDPAQAGGGFRRGFLLVVALAVILLLLYVFAPQIGRAVPALSDVMNEYVIVVNDGRRWLDGQAAALMLWLDGMASSAPAAEGS